MSSAEKYIPKYCVADYRLWEGDWQLVEGIAVSMSPSPLGPHERAISRLIALFTSELDTQHSDCCPYAGLDWIVSDETVVRPDLMIVCGDAPEGHLDKPPVLAVEVLSPSTWKLDTDQKHRIYKDNGVGVYLIVDTDLKKIEVANFKNETTATIGNTESTSIQLEGDLTIDLSAEKIFR